MIPRTLSAVEFECDVSGDQNFPLWPCPACDHGVLQLSGGSIKFASSAEIGFAIDEGHLNPWDDRGVFAATLTCANTACWQGVATLGDFSNDTPDGIYMVPGRGFECRIVRRYVVKAIYPALKLINIPKDISNSIVSPLEQSFGLYWTDPQACATAIRIAIEKTADGLGERRLGRNSRTVSLGIHLNDLKVSHPKLMDAFSIITKTLGNAGAHGKPIERNDLLVAYELLEIELQALSNDMSGRRDALIAQLR
ncbi:MAG TPA: DUF4145 domain-containing protein [Micropepsaceae bacterium]|nr:DUF4145 domain-containing protein [Micropepsaceae bacterium]